MKNHNSRLLALLLGIMLAFTLCACAKKAQAPAPEAPVATDEVPEEEEDSKKDTDEVPEEGQMSDDDSSSDQNDEDWDGPVGDEEYDGPTDFLQEQSGRTEFKDNDDVISCLKSGQGYAIINLKGGDSELLLVTKKVGEDGTATDATVYGMFNGAYMSLTDVGAYADGFDVLRLDDGILYAGSDDKYESYFLEKDSGSIIMKDWVMKGTDDGKVKFTGFMREENDFDHDKNFEGGEAEFDAMLKDRSTKAPLVFTVVK